MENQLEITADVVDYLGKYEDGVIVLLSISYKNKYTDGTLYYSDKMLALTVDESIEKDLNMPIELWSEYKELLVSILKRVVPYNEIINRLDEIDFSQYFGDIDLDSSEAEDINTDDIKEEE
jgi:hypothetical protein